MSRRVGLHMYVTLDGYNEFPTYPGSEPSNNEPDLIAEEMWIKRWESIDALLFDRLTYEQWSEFWPLANRTAQEHPWFRQMSEFAERTEKVVLGETPPVTSWANTRVMPGDAGATVERLRTEHGGRMAVVAPSLGMELLRRDLIDDYYFAIMPVVLGSGHRFFEKLSQQRNLRLVEVKTFQAGELFLHYEAAR